MSSGQDQGTTPAAPERPVLDAIATRATSGGRRMTVFGVITILLGIIAMSAPLITGLSIVVTVGFLVMVGGVLRMLWAFGEGSFGRGALAFAIGGLTLLCGLAMVSDPIVASGFLTVLIAVCLFADGVVEVIGALQVHPDAGRMWLLIGGIASIVLGVLIWRQFPLSGAWAIGIFLGIKLLFVGIVMIAGGRAVRGIGKRAGALV